MLTVGNNQRRPEGAVGCCAAERLDQLETSTRVAPPSCLQFVAISDSFSGRAAASAVQVLDRRA